MTSIEPAGLDPRKCSAADPDQRTSIGIEPALTVSDKHAHRSNKLNALQWAAIGLGAAGTALLIYGSLTGEHSAAALKGATAHAPAIWSVIPFVGLLLAIALLPLIPATAQWWENNQNRLMVALCFAAVTLAYYLSAYGAAKVAAVLEHAVVAEYIPFIVLLFSLYVISGGICLKGDLAAHPATNTAFLAIGAVIASFVGTTGASMLLIRPLLQTNAERKHVKHTVIFFIFLVSNIGGCLLPIGDPPLFLGYLKGIHFLWTFKLVVEWAVTCGILLVIYYIWDCRAYRREMPPDIVRDETQRIKLAMTGKLNLLWLVGIVPCVALVKPGEEFLGLGFETFPFMREVLMLCLVALSVKLTPTQVRADNRFNYHAILEVAALFIGIFICMQAPIEILKAGGATLSAYLSSPLHFFWATGALSSFLDNAPTYVVFFETASSVTPANAAGVITLPDGSIIRESLLVGVSLGAVFMGSMTYIGNGPNFMVKSIAEQSGIHMPSFFGYMLYSCGILIPLFIVVSFIFLGA